MTSPKYRFHGLQQDGFTVATMVTYGCDLTKSVIHSLHQSGPRRGFDSTQSYGRDRKQLRLQPYRDIIYIGGFLLLHGRDHECLRSRPCSFAVATVSVYSRDLALLRLQL